MERSVDKAALPSRIIQECKHFGNKITSKEEVKSTIIMAITMKASFLYPRKMGKGFINGRIRQDIRGNLGVIILLEIVESSLLIMSSMKVEYLMEKEKALAYIGIRMEMSSKDSGRMMKN